MNKYKKIPIEHFEAAQNLIESVEIFERVCTDPISDSNLIRIATARLFYHLEKMQEVTKDRKFA